MKFRQLWSRRKSIIVTWLLSYSAVLIVPMIMSLLIYGQSSKALNSEIHRANDSLLKQMRYNIDTQIDLMKRLNMEVTWNDKLQKLMYSNKSPSDAQYLAYQLVQDFRMYQTSYASIDEFYVIWDQESTILRPGNVRDLSTAFDTIHNTGSMTYREWQDVIKSTPNNGFVLLPHMDSSTPQSAIAFVSHMPKGMNGKSAGTVVTMADTERFAQAIESIQGFSGGHVLILNEDNEVLMSNQPITSSVKSMLDQMPDGEEQVFTRGENNDTELVYIGSGVSGLKYVLMLPSNLYWQKAEYVRNFTYVSIFISLCGAGALTWFFLRRNYNPIRQLVQSLSDKEMNEERQDWNELRFIQKAISHTRSEKEQIALQWKHHHHVLRSNMLTRLLKGRLDSAIPTQEAFKTFQIQLISNHYAVLLFGVEDNERLYSSLAGMEMHEKRRFIQFIITNVVEELVGQRAHQGYVAEVDDMMVCLVNFQESGDVGGFREDLNWIAAEAQRFLKRFQMNITVAVSSVQETLSGVSQAYQEALDAMEYKMVLGKSEIITYDDIRTDNSDRLGFYYPLQVEQQVINCIKAGDYENASRIMQEITTRNFDKPMVSLALARCLIFNMAGTIVKAIHELGSSENVLGDNPHWLDRIIACDTVQEMQEQLLALLEAVCRFAAEKVESGAANERAEALSDLIGQVIHYLQSSYHDANLNVNAMGERFQLKASYLSKLFKDHTGIGLPDYLNKFRIGEAKKLIVDKQVSVNEAARLVGFNEVATFIRVFKKYEGVTPGKYKESITFQAGRLAE